MVKFFKSGRVVVVMNGRQAGKKGIIVKTSYENTRDRKYPHCLVVGLSKTSRRVTKNFLKKNAEKVGKLESLLNDQTKSKNAQTRLNKLKRMGVFIRSYNMSHLLATRYKMELDEFKIDAGISSLDNIEQEIKKVQSDVNRLIGEHKTDDASKKTLEDAKKQLTSLKDNYKTSLREVKAQIGSELYNRYFKGFIREKNASAEDNEKMNHTEFLFKKLKF